MPAALIDSQFEAIEPPVEEPNEIAVSVNQSIDRVVAEALQKLQPMLTHE